jgi:hypothetical protein
MPSARLVARWPTVVERETVVVYEGRIDNAKLTEG